jgi:hypothetical protein
LVGWLFALGLKAMPHRPSMTIGAPPARDRAPAKAPVSAL